MEKQLEVYKEYTTYHRGGILLPKTCEVCGSKTTENTETEQVQQFEILHICEDCIGDRHVEMIFPNL